MFFNLNNMTPLEYNLYHYIMDTYPFWDKTKTKIINLSITDIKNNYIYYSLSYSNGIFITGLTDHIPETTLYDYKRKLRKQKLEKLCSNQEIK